MMYDNIMLNVKMSVVSLIVCIRCFRTWAIFPTSGDLLYWKPFYHFSVLKTLATNVIGQ
jgi:hypothetical protein